MRMKSINYKCDLVKIGSRIIYPVIKELPFIVSFLLLSGIILILQSIHGRMYNPEAYPSYLYLFGKLSLSFFEAYVCALILVRTGKIWVKISIYLIILLLFSIQFFLKDNFSIRISPALFTLLAETNSSEAKEFINQYIFSYTFCNTLKYFFSYVILICCLEIGWNKYLFCKIIKFRSRVINIIIILIIICSVILSCIYSYKFIYKGIYKSQTIESIVTDKINDDPICATISTLIMLHRTSANLKNAIEITKHINVPAIDENYLNDTLNIVVVIGESYIKAHSELYGYYLPTSPYLEKEKEKGSLYVFNDVITMNNLTSAVMKNILSCNNSSNGEQWFDFPLLPAVFKKAGYNVLFWDNQKKAFKGRPFTFTLNSFLYDPDVIDNSFSAINDSSYTYDEDIVKSFNNYKHSHHLKRQNLVMFHLMGQHHNAFERYPANFNQFTADDIKRNDSYLDNDKKTYIAQYDNATLYNDFVLRQIISIFENEPTILIYFSDHGEEVYDYRNQRSRDQGPLTREKLKYQYEIPFMVWCSDLYKTKYPEVVKSIEVSVDKPFSIDLLYNLLFGISGIKTNYYHAEWDVLSDTYDNPVRKINNMTYKK